MFQLNLIMVNIMGKVTMENNVVINTITDAYSFSLLKLSANIDVVAAAGIALRIVMVFATFEVSPISNEIK